MRKYDRPPLRPATEFTEVQKITPCPGIGKKRDYGRTKNMTGAPALNNEFMDVQKCPKELGKRRLLTYKKM